MHDIPYMELGRQAEHQVGSQHQRPYEVSKASRGQIMVVIQRIQLNPEGCGAHLSRAIPRQHGDFACIQSPSWQGLSERETLISLVLTPQRPLCGVPQASEGVPEASVFDLWVVASNSASRRT